MALPRVRAPELRGAGGWINVERLSLAELRGKVVVLDFWTAGCLNCVRVLEELRRLEARFGDDLVVVGIRSPKFAHERDPGALPRAVERLGIAHPVLDDADGALWSAYAVRAWPTLVVVDAEGRVVAGVAGEGQAEVLARQIERALAEGAARGRLRSGPLRAEGGPLAGGVDGGRRPRAGSGELRFPGKVAVEPGGERLAIADTGHDRVLVCDRDGLIEASHEGLRAPQGVRFDGDALLVCETGADRVWRIVLDPGEDGERELLADGLASPWDVVRMGADVVVAEAPRHRLWAVSPDGERRVLTGTGGENLVDGPAATALLAQPSGLAVLPGGGGLGGLAVADAESSALRLLRGGELSTLVGQGLFEWGTADGDRDLARLQHPLGVATAPDGTLFVADTYNGRLRAWRDGTLTTVDTGGLDEPGGLDVLPDGRLVVADTNHHRIVVVDPSSDAPPEALRVRARPLALALLGEGPACRPGEEC